MEIRAGHAAPARIGCAASHVSHFLAGCIRELADADPHVPFPVVVPISTGTAIEALSTGAVELVVEPRQKRVGPNAALLYPIHVVAVGPAATDLAAGGVLDVRKLNDVPLATMPPDSLVHRLLTDAAAAAGVSLRIVYESRDANGLLGLAKEALCTAVLHDEMLDEQHERIAAHLTSRRRKLSASLWLEWQREDALSPAALALRDVMLRRARTQRDLVARRRA
jgi:hypothetical protein